MIDLSIIVTTHDERQYLSKILDTLLPSLRPSMELLVIDDGSQDGSNYLIEEYLSLSPNFRYVWIRNRGLGGARNLGIALMRGKLGVFLDVDDELDAGHLWDAVAQNVLRENLDFAMFQTENYANSRRLEPLAKTANEYFYKSPGVVGSSTSGHNLAASLISNKSYSVPAWQYVWNRSFIESEGIRFREGVVMEDNLFTFLLMSRARHCRFIRATPHKRLIRSGSIMQTGDSGSQFRGYLDAYVQMTRFLSREPKESELWQVQVIAGIRWHLMRLGSILPATFVLDAIEQAEGEISLQDQRPHGKRLGGNRTSN